MKHIKYFIAAFLLMFVTIGSAQTPFPSGIRFPNINQVTTADSIPVMGSNGVIKSWIPADSLRGGGIQSVVGGTNVTVNNTDPLNPVISATGATGLEAIKHSHGVGWRLIGRDPLNYSSIGHDAVDFSTSQYASSTAGASGNQSFASGVQTTASGNYSTAMGDNSIASGTASIALQGNAIGDASIALGGTASGVFSKSLGRFSNARSFLETTLGSTNTNYTPLSTTAWNDSDRLVSIGNGSDYNVYSDAFTILKNAQVGIDIDNFEANTTGEKFQVNGTGKFSGTLKIGAYTLPATDGVAGQVLKTSGSGIVTWQNDSGGSGSTDYISNVSVTGNTMNFTGTGSAFNGSVTLPTGSGVGNLQQVTDIGYVTTNPIESGSYLQSGQLVTVPARNEHRVILRNSNNFPIFRQQVNRWDGSGFISANGFFIGENAGNGNLSEQSNGFGYFALGNNTGNYSNGFGNRALSENTGNNSNGFGNYALRDNTGSYSNGFGNLALRFNTGVYSNGFGASALENNTGNISNGFGYNVLRNNSGLYANGFGSIALQDNTGDNANGFGNSALTRNTGNDSNGMGTSSLSRNSGNSSNGFGNSALQNNTGDNSNGIGTITLLYNNEPNNTAIGHNSFSGFYEDVSNKKDFVPSDVNLTLQTITIPSHGFGANNEKVNLRYTTTGAGLWAPPLATAYMFVIIDQNTIAPDPSYTPLATTGSGIHSLTPQFVYTNTTTIGANSQPTKSNQVVLGDANVTEVVMGNGNILSPFETIDTGATVALTSSGGNLCNMGAANTNTAYTTTGTVLNAYAKILINTTSQPTVNGIANPIKGAAWVANTDMYLVIYYTGAARGVEYFFLEI